jgi:hypothetical protein
MGARRGHNAGMSAPGSTLPEPLQRFVQVVCALAAVAVCSGARASELRIDGAVDCADRGQLLFELERALGKPLGAAGNLAFDVQVETSPGRASARMSVRAPAAATVSERTLNAADCPRLLEMLAVAISLAIDGSEHAASAPRGDGAAPPQVLPIQGAASSVTTPAATEAPTGTASEVRGGPRPRASAFIAGDVGSLPAPALGVGLGLELGWPRLRVALMATRVFARRADWSSSSDAGAEVSLTAGTARACVPALPDRSSSLSIPLCIGAELGRLEGVGRGISPARSRAMFWLAPRAEAGLSWAVPGTWLGLETTLAALLPLNRDEFVLDGRGTIHRPSSVVGRLSASLNLRFE